ncbi:MAG TPA: S-layer homology domain-containing protein [Anaerolineales bacterium]|nr:S-layer homology domain-containing protein [Anaerolineales bacterium]
MKRYRDFLLGALIATLLFASFSVGRASAASSGCFTDTNGHWAESFICWLKDNGISSGYADGSYRPDNSITRGEMAVMLKKVNDASLAAAKQYTDASLAREIQVVMPPSEWRIGAESLLPWLQLDLYLSSAKLTSSAISTGQGVIAMPTVPTTMNGKRLAVSKAQVCFEELHITSYVDKVYIYSLPTSGEGISFDNNAHINPGCITYSFAPYTLQENHYLYLYIGVNWTTTTYPIGLGQVTFYLTPTTTTVP